MVDDGYYSQESVLHWKFTDIKEWCQLKTKIPVSHGVIYYGDGKINFLQELAWWLTDLMLRGKIIDLNNLKNDILADAIEESRIDFEDRRCGKGYLRNPKEF